MKKENASTPFFIPSPWPDYRKNSVNEFTEVTKYKHIIFKWGMYIDNLMYSNSPYSNPLLSFSIKKLRIYIL
jgi:hypothetical protein